MFMATLRAMGILVHDSVALPLSDLEQEQMNAEKEHSGFTAHQGAH